MLARRRLYEYIDIEFGDLIGLEPRLTLSSKVKEISHVLQCTTFSLMQPRYIGDMYVLIVHQSIALRLCDSSLRSRIELPKNILHFWLEDMP